MSEHEHESGRTYQPHCCPCCLAEESDGITRRGFLGGMGGAAIGGMALTYLSISELMAADVDLPTALPRKPLVVKPVLSYDTPTRRSQTSWRNWAESRPSRTPMPRRPAFAASWTSSRRPPISP